MNATNRDREQAKMAICSSDDLEPYRRLVELQKQMIELSQQHEQTKRERDALRKQVARERAQQLRSRRSFRHHLHRSAEKILKRMPATFGNRRPATINGKKSSPC
jgi:seryl-tRNA synthetase